MIRSYQGKPGHSKVLLCGRIGAAHWRRGAWRTRQRLDERRPARRRAFYSRRRAFEHSGLQCASRHERAIWRRPGRVRHGRPLGDPARLRDRRPLPDRHGIDHPERREHRRRFDHRGGYADPGKTIVEPGSLWMGSPGKFRRKLERKIQEMIMRYAK